MAILEAVTKNKFREFIAVDLEKYSENLLLVKGVIFLKPAATGIPDGTLLHTNNLFH